MPFSPILKDKLPPFKKPISIQMKEMEGM